MHVEELNKIVNNRLKRIKDTLVSKADEYASSFDRMHNFKRAANMLGCTPEQALFGFVTKHIIATMDMIDGVIPVSEKQIDEKLGDIMVYMVLLEGLMMERLRLERGDK